MHIIVQSGREILLKYDVGAAKSFNKEEEPVTLNLPDELKMKIFNNSTSLNRKIDAIEALF